MAGARLRQVATARPARLRPLRELRTRRAGPAMTSVDHGAIGTAIACLRLDQPRMARPPRAPTRRPTMTATTVPARAPALKTTSPLYKSLFVQVLVALIIGTILGVATPGFAVSLKILSDAFLKLISMIVAPIVFCVVVHGIAGAGDLKKVGRVGVKALIFFET